MWCRFLLFAETSEIGVIARLRDVDDRERFRVCWIFVDILLALDVNFCVLAAGEISGGISVQYCTLSPSKAHITS